MWTLYHLVIHGPGHSAPGAGGGRGERQHRGRDRGAQGRVQRQEDGRQNELLQLNVDLPYTIDLNLTLIPRLFFFSNFLILFRS